MTVLNLALPSADTARDAVKTLQEVSWDGLRPWGEEVDWNERWKSLMQMRKNHAPASSTLWACESSARHYWQTVNESGMSWIEDTISRLNVTPSSRVLDIGAGPGTHAVHLAPRVSHITAVEPSPGMMDLLTENIEGHRLKNIRCVPKRWEDVRVDEDLSPPYDVVLASFSLDMADLKEAVNKMASVCRGEVSMWWFAGEPTWTTHYKRLWPTLHGKPYCPAPKSDILFQILYQMGIYPAMEVHPREYPARYTCPTEAVQLLRFEYGASTTRQIGLLKDYLMSLLEKDDHGYVLRHFFYAVEIWWRCNR
jgi:SAM-dependent methyltransferase